MKGIELNFNYDNGRGNIVNLHRVINEFKPLETELETIVNEFKIFLYSAGFDFEQIRKIPGKLDGEIKAEF